MTSLHVPIVIPAYCPGEALVRIVHELDAAGVSNIVVVNDGSGPEYEHWFDSIRGFSCVHILCHSVNLGKGAALKTGINYAICRFPCAGVATADADGQHATQDVLRIAGLLDQHPGSLILGTREFRTGVPLRSLVGNTITRAVVRAVIGRKFGDTQTGLRGIPRELAAELLRIPSNGYEFELDMLIAVKHQGYPVREEPISTIYLGRNESSHFNPVTDSMRIYFVLLRFGMVSLMTAILDNAVFLTMYHATQRVWESQLVGRVGAVAFNYVLARKAVFLSRERHRSTLPKYLALVAVNGLISYTMINILNLRFGMRVPGAKILAESILFLANFAIQRDFIFTRGSPRKRVKQGGDH